MTASEDSEQQSGEMREGGPPPGMRPGSEEDYARIRKDLVRAIAQTCPPWLSRRSEDLVQGAMIRVFEVQRRSPDAAELSFFYLKKVAYSTVIDEIRRLRRRPESPLDDSLAETGPEAPYPGPDRYSSSREVGRAIHGCLGAMIRPRRTAVMLHLQGHSIAEFAPRIGWPVKKAQNLVYRGLADLRECLQKRGLEP